MAKGKVKWYNDVKGFGFIISDAGEDIFVHRTSLDSPFSGLEEGEDVSFEVKKGEKGLVAFNVKTVN
ncbi:MAG: cold shock domain-containing protein [Bacteroidetes bacterium]|nr:cold shock domain-containing protein [Bacteroidota bacterium]